MRPSRYNHIFRVNGRTILAYNAMTTAMVTLDEQELGLWTEFVAHPRPDYFEAQGLDEWRDQLLEAGLLVPDDDDELLRLQEAHREIVSGVRHLGLTLLPTLDCNFRCGYCFSYAHKEHMSPQVQDALLRFVEERLPGAGSLSIHWFGGEPTLCPDIIEGLASRISEACAAHGTEVLPGGIVTNGYLLDERMARRLAQAGVASAQVTLDGDRQTHDARRRLRNGRGTFERILDNVAASCELLRITIRINVDRDNAATACRAFDALSARRLQGKVLVGFGHVKSYTEACADAAGSCLAGHEFSTVELALTKEAVLRGFAGVPYPEPRPEGHCGADKKSVLVVAPDGLLFKCWAEASLGQAASVGSLLQPDPSPQQAANLRRYLEWDPVAAEPCRGCRLLPVCMGGCPHLRMLPGGEPDCCSFKHVLPDLLMMNYLVEEQRNQRVPVQAGPR